MYLVTVLLMALGFLPLQALSDPAGHWEGKIQMPNRELAITIDVGNAGGGWVGSMSVVQSTAENVPLENLTVSAQGVHFTARLPMQATFDGTLWADHRAWSGTASNEQGSASFELTRTGDGHVSVPPPSSALPKALEGRWEGTIDVNGKPLGVAVKLWAAADGTARGTLISVGPPAEEIPLTTVIATDRGLEFESRAVSGTYRGTIDASGQIVGEWKQRTTALPLTLHRALPAGDGKLTGS